VVQLAVMGAAAVTLAVFVLVAAFVLVVGR
jgi:hypothetical protein